MTNNATHGTPAESTPIAAPSSTPSRVQLPPYVMAGIAKIMIGEALRPDGVNVSADEAVRWLDVLDSTAPPAA